MGIDKGHEYESAVEQRLKSLLAERGDLDRLVVGQGLPDTATLGRLIRKSRTEQGVSASELATRVGVSPSYIRAIERGERAPAPAVAKDILGALDFSIDDSADATDRQVDVVVQRGDQRFWIDFKHWTGPAAAADENRRDALFLWLAEKAGAPGAAVGAVTAGVVARQGRQGGESEEEDATAGDRNPAQVRRRLKAAIERLRARQDRQDASDAVIGRIVRQLPLLDSQSIELLGELIEASATNGTPVREILGPALDSLDDPGPDNDPDS